MVESSEEAAELALAFVRAMWQLAWTPVVSSTADHGSFWIVEYNSRQFVEDHDQDCRVAVQPLAVDKASALVTVWNPNGPAPGLGSWEEVTAAWRRFHYEVIRLRRRPDVVALLRSERLSPVVGEVVMSGPCFDLRVELAEDLVYAAIRGRDIYLARSRQLLHLLPRDSLQSALGVVLEGVKQESDAGEHEYCVNSLIDLCIELGFGDELDALHEHVLAGGSPDEIESIEAAAELRKDERYWGKSRDLWPRKGTGA
jgi:hypothetical protein